MPKQPVSEGERLLRVRMQARLCEQDRKDGRAWAHTGGKLYRWARAFLWLFTVYGLLVLTLNLLIFWLMDRSAYALTAEERAFYTADSWLVWALAALFAGCLAALLFARRRPMIAAILQTAALPLLALHTAQILTGQYAQKALLAGLFAPCFLACLAGLCLVCTLVADRRRLDRAVEKEYTRLYDRYHNPDDTLTSDEAWHAFLNDHEQALARGEKPPAADRLRRKE